jgi:excisionase family DNA binding protein
MATDIESLVDQAMAVRRRLEERGAADDAKVVERLVQELTSARPKAERPYYTVSEVAELIGVSGQTVKNWISRDMLKGYRLGGRIVIPRSELDDYRSMAEASKSIEPLPSREEIVDAIREGRRHFLWPMEPQKNE